MVKKEKIINNKKTLKSETVLTDGKNYSSIKITPNSIELRVEKIKSYYKLYLLFELILYLI